MSSLSGRQLGGVRSCSSGVRGRRVTEPKGDIEHRRDVFIGHIIVGAM